MQPERQALVEARLGAGEVGGSGPRGRLAVLLPWGSWVGIAGVVADVATEKLTEERPCVCLVS